MADITVSNDVDALMRSADNAEIVANLALPSAEAILNPLVEGQGLLNSFVGSSAAYSLRDLNKTNPDVVEVRRGSDETSRVFKANEIGSTLENWVNAEVALPLDTASGAAAAYSLRNLSTSYSGNVVDVRRSSDGTEASFTAAEVAGSTMVNWVGVGNDGYVTKWYDQSGNDNHAVQTTEASQPKIVDAGTLVADGLKFDGVDDWIGLDNDLGLSGDDAPISYFTVADAGSTATSTSHSIVSLGNSTNNNPISYLGKDDTNYRFFERDDAGTLLSLNAGTFNASSVFTGITTGNARTGYADGSNIISDSTDHGQKTFDRFTLGALRRVTTANFVNGTISEIIIYNSDQTDNRKAIESNMADYHGNIDLPAGFDSGNNEVDGFVATWYDQSGNGNNATQPISTSQPKIVEGGVLVADGITFDEAQSLGVTGNPVITSAYTGTFSGFSVQKLANDTGYVYSNNSSSNGWAVRTEGASLLLMNKFSGGDTISHSVNTTQLVSFVYNNGTSGLLVNGQGTVTAGTYDFPASTNDFTIGSREGGSIESHFLDGTISEIIIYDSDQSLVRKNIEFNINNAYSIY